MAGVDYTRVLERIKLSVQHARLMSDEDLQVADREHEPGIYRAPTNPHRVGILEMVSGPGVFFATIPDIPRFSEITEEIWLADRELSKTLSLTGR